MSGHEFETVDVFTEAPFGGNQLAVFTSAEGLSDAEMQALAAEMNYSETTFALPPKDPAHHAQIRIFHRTAEMPFAGHPNVGTAFVLGRRLPGSTDRLVFEELAGLVEARLLRVGDEVCGAEIDAPQPLTVFEEFAADDIAACAGIDPRGILCHHHRPTRISVGVDFVVAEVAAEGLAQAAPDLSAFRRVAAGATGPIAGRLSRFMYCRREASPLRARMFAPLARTFEDPATGSAQAALGAFTLSLSGEHQLSYEAVQGVEMGRPSRLRVRAERRGGGIHASIGGMCKPMFRGSYWPQSR